METDEESKVLVEKIGVYLEKVADFQPVSARIVGYLLISEPPYKSFEEILKYLQVSKSSISQGINLLLSQDHLDYITFSGNRKRYFRLNYNSWFNTLKKMMSIYSQLKVLFQEILNHRSNKYEEFNNQLASLIDFFEIFEKEIPAIFKKLDKK
jgi:DNA-binding transcriptional regulator GbsR (MarR family)